VSALWPQIAALAALALVLGSAALLRARRVLD
jgi:hypothetical protein